MAEKRRKAGGAITEFYGKDPQALGTQESIGYLIKLAHTQLIKNIDIELQPYDLTAKQWIPLQILSRDKVHTVASCASDAGIDAGAMTRMLDRLETKALVFRERSTEDRRVVYISLSDTGRRLVENIPPAVSKVLNHHLAGFSRKEFESFKGLLIRFLANGETAIG